jgi:hypothetical protein
MVNAGSAQCADPWSKGPSYCEDPATPPTPTDAPGGWRACLGFGYRRPWATPQPATAGYPPKVNDPLTASPNGCPISEGLSLARRPQYKKRCAPEEAWRACRVQSLAGRIRLIDALVRLAAVTFMRVGIQCTPSPWWTAEQPGASRPVSSCSRLRRCISRRRSSIDLPVHQHPTMMNVCVTARTAIIGISCGWRGIVRRTSHVKVSRARSLVMVAASTFGPASTLRCCS